MVLTRQMSNRSSSSVKRVSWKERDKRMPMYVDPDSAAAGDMSCGVASIVRSSSFRGNSMKRARREPHWIYNIRQNFAEQLKCLDTRLESHLAMLTELQDFYKRRADVEMDYSKALDRLVRQIMIRQKRELWPGYSTYTSWQTLLSSTKRQSKDHSVLGDLYNNQMSNRFQELMEDVQRMYRKCRDTALSCHEDLIKVLNELEKAMKRYHANHGESKASEVKLRYMENQKQKLEQHSSKGTLSRKLKSMEKQTKKKKVPTAALR